MPSVITLSNEVQLRSPLIMIGAHRSGTTWLGEALSKAADIAYWPEPNHVWTWGNWSLPDDVLGPEHATPRVKAHLHRVFHRYTRRVSSEKFCEKTPSNCLRVPFIREVFPDAKYIFLVRDGRSIFRSTRQVLDEGVAWIKFVNRFRRMSPGDLPYMVSRLPRVLGKLTGQTPKYWGPRPEGWQTWLENDSTNVMLAKQWACTIAKAAADFEQMDPAQYVTLRYEDMLASPREAMTQVLEFLEVRDVQPVFDYVETSVDRSRLQPWRETLDPELLDEVRPHMEATLARMGYSW